MFDSMMKQLHVLYDPMPKKRAGENQPEIVHFVMGLQDKHLLRIDAFSCLLSQRRHNPYTNKSGLARNW